MKCESINLLEILFSEPEIETPIVTPKPIVAPIMRNFYRCCDCLQVSATEQELPMEYSIVKGIKCSCGGKIEFMGKVKKDKIGHEIEQSVCDARCTEAIGPHCGCKCGGINHGSHKTVTVFYETGEVPVLTPPNKDKSDKISLEYHTAMDATKSALNAKYGTVRKLYDDHIWMDRSQFMLYVESKHKWARFWEISKMSHHAARIKAFAKLNEREKS